MNKNTFKLMIAAVICGVVFAGCGGGSGSGGSKLKKNEYLGSLPSIYADYSAKKKAHEENIEKEGAKLMAGGEKNASKLMKLMKEDEETTKSLKEKMKTAVSDEIAKVAGKEIPVSFSKELQESGGLFYDVSPVKLVENGGELAAAISLSAKDAFDVPRMKGYDYSTYFRFITSEGETIVTSVLLPVKLEHKAFSIAANQHLLDFNFPLYLSNKPEQWVKFAGIEFITKAEYDSSNQ